MTSTILSFKSWHPANGQRQKTVGHEGCANAEPIPGNLAVRYQYASKSNGVLDALNIEAVPLRSPVRVLQRRPYLR
jgi:hypothetical protein